MLSCLVSLSGHGWQGRRTHGPGFSQLHNFLFNFQDTRSQIYQEAQRCGNQRRARQKINLDRTLQHCSTVQDQHKNTAAQSRVQHQLEHCSHNPVCKINTRTLQHNPVCNIIVAQSCVQDQLQHCSTIHVQHYTDHIKTLQHILVC